MKAICKGWLPLSHLQRPTLEWEATGESKPCQKGWKEDDQEAAVAVTPRKQVASSTGGLQLPLPPKSGEMGKPTPLPFSSNETDQC